VSRDGQSEQIAGFWAPSELCFRTIELFTGRVAQPSVSWSVGRRKNIAAEKGCVLLEASEGWGWRSYLSMDVPKSPSWHLMLNSGSYNFMGVSQSLPYFFKT
jgi:hypothetical protein